jgi:hypothetical protein
VGADGLAVAVAVAVAVVLQAPKGEAYCLCGHKCHMLGDQQTTFPPSDPHHLTTPPVSQK